MNEELVDILRIYEYTLKRRRAYAQAAPSLTAPASEEYLGRVGAYDDVLEKLEQVIESIQVSAGKWNQTVQKILRKTRSEVDAQS